MSFWQKLIKTYFVTNFVLKYHFVKVYFLNAKHQQISRYIQGILVFKEKTETFCDGCKKTIISGNSEHPNV